MNIDDYCRALSEQLAARESMDERLEIGVAAVAKAFSVRPGEVAFFRLEPGGEALSFLWPMAFRQAGTIPVSSRSSLVARTAAEKTPTLNNAFAATPHAFYFEQFRKDESTAGGLPIQKIMSVPLVRDGAVTGVLQVARKAESPALAGKDFTPVELQALARIADTLATHLSPS